VDGADAADDASEREGTALVRVAAEMSTDDSISRPTIGDDRSTRLVSRHA